MVAYRYAAMHPDEVQQLVLMDAAGNPARGAGPGAMMPRAWHANFHNVRDLPSCWWPAVNAPYLTPFFKSRNDPLDALSDADIDVYVQAYSAPGAMRAGFRALPRLGPGRPGQRTLPACKRNWRCSLRAGASASGAPLLEGMMHEIAHHGRFHCVENAGHYKVKRTPRRRTPACWTSSAAARWKPEP